jgi:hypothetical protein
MLERARRKGPELEWVEGDLLALPFEDRSFQAATVGFGIRNVPELEDGLREAIAGIRAGRFPARPGPHCAECPALDLLCAGPALEWQG